jgi:hypothetical protein
MNEKKTSSADLHFPYPAMFGYLVQFHGFRPVMWIQLGLSGILTVILFFLAKETRADVLLARKARKLRKTTGDKRYATQSEEERESIPTMLRIALTRPWFLLLTEPIIQAFTALLSFTYAVLYLLLVAIPIVFARVYQFNTGQIGLIYLSQAAGTFVGAGEHSSFLSMHQQGNELISILLGITVYTNRLYHKKVAEKGAEARLYSGMFGGVCLPIGAWLFAWTSLSTVHWIAPTIGIAILYTGIFLIYLTCFSESAPLFCMR